MSDIVSHRIIKSVDEEYEYPLNIWEERIYQQGRADAIDEFTNELINDGKISAMRVLKIKEQLKEQANETD